MQTSTYSIKPFRFAVHFGDMSRSGSRTFHSDIHWCKRRVLGTGLLLFLLGTGLLAPKLLAEGSPVSKPVGRRWTTGPSVGNHAKTLALLDGRKDTNSNPSEAVKRFEFQQIRMGIPFRIVLYAPDEASANTASRDAFRRIKQLDRMLSDYDPDSELRQLCRTSGSGRSVPVSDELRLVLARSVALSRETDGAFDVTVGPYVKLWRKARRKKLLPQPEDLKLAGTRVGFRAIQLHPKSKSVTLHKPGMLLDLGGIAKGYACDEALDELRKHGISSALVDGGGDIVVSDPPPGRSSWKIAIEASVGPERKPNRFVSLRNAAVATSGDAYQSVTIDNVRYSHLVDPHTGLGLTQRSSVTVIARDGITADSLASAVSVLGSTKGIALIECKDSTAALVVESKETGVQAIESKRFAKYYAPK